jgi:DinB superfamily
MTNHNKIAIIQGFVPRLRSQVTGLTPEQLTTQYNPPEWTVAQNVHHLVDSHTHGYLIFKLFLTTDDARMPPYNTGLFATMPDGSDANIEDSLLILEGLHTRWARMLNNISDWNKVGFYPGIDEPTTLDTVLMDKTIRFRIICQGHISS